MVLTLDNLLELSLPLLRAPKLGHVAHIQLVLGL